MDFNDFLTTFTLLEVSHFPTVFISECQKFTRQQFPLPKWRAIFLKSEWTAATAGGGLDNPG